MYHFGIIGNPLGHSQSKTYFDRRFPAEGIDATFNEYQLERIEDVRPLLDSLDGMNVTSPFKQQIIPYLRDLDRDARAIGAVNVVCDGIGYNTDWYGVVDTFHPALLPDDRQALVLGSGGAARAVGYGLQQLGLSVRYVSRSPQRGDFTYEDLAARPEIIKTCSVIANATPLGMAPLQNKAPLIPYEALDSHHLLFDCIYNPAETLFLSRGRQQGTRLLNGQNMFVAQADHAYMIYRRHMAMEKA